MAPTFLDDLRYLTQANARLASRALELVEAIRRDPFVGVGKPERLRHETPNTWSRRIDKEHRLVYRVLDDHIELVRCRGHYG